MSPHERFLALIVDFVGPAPQGVLETVQNEMLVDADGPVRLVLDPQREEISFSTLVYCSSGAPDDLDAELVADFNAYHLRHGGFRLSIEADVECVTIAQTKSLSRIEAIGLDAFFVDFIAQSAACARWYSTKVARGARNASRSGTQDSMMIA